MIDKEQASDVLKSFSGPVLTDLHAWIDHEIEELRKKFDFAKDFNEVRYLQGSIQSLQKLKDIREYAADIIEKKQHLKIGR